MRKFLACSIVGLAVFGGALVACSSSGGGSSQAEFCATLKKDQTAFSSLSDSSDISSDKSESLAIQAFNDLASKAPSEIKSDMATIAQFEKDFVANKKSTVSQSDFIKATTNVAKYAKDKCGVDLASDTSSSSSSRSSKSSSSDNFSDLSNFSNFSNLSDFSSSLSSALSDFSNFSDLSSLTSAFSDLSSLTDLSSLFSR